jgi:hypothetical protein
VAISAKKIFVESIDRRIAQSEHIESLLLSYIHFSLCLVQSLNLKLSRQLVLISKVHKLITVFKTSAANDHPLISVKNLVNHLLLIFRWNQR